MDVAEASNPICPTAPAAPLLLVSAKLFTADGKMLVTLLEMSTDYAVAAATAPPPAGSIAVLSRGGSRMTVTVAWVDRQRIGLRFDRAIDEALLAQFAG